VIRRVLTALAILVGASLGALAYGIACLAGLDYRGRDLAVAVVIGAVVLVFASRTVVARALALRAGVALGSRMARRVVRRARRRAVRAGRR
jgi:hypothetical protein